MEEMLENARTYNVYNNVSNIYGSAVQSQKAVTAHFKIKKLLPFDFADLI